MKDKELYNGLCITCHQPVEPERAAKFRRRCEMCSHYEARRQRNQRVRKNKIMRCWVPMSNDIYPNEAKTMVIVTDLAHEVYTLERGRHETWPDVIDPDFITAWRDMPEAYTGGENEIL